MLRMILKVLATLDEQEQTVKDIQGGKLENDC